MIWRRRAVRDGRRRHRGRHDLRGRRTALTTAPDTRRAGTGRAAAGARPRRRRSRWRIGASRGRLVGRRAGPAPYAWRDVALVHVAVRRAASRGAGASSLVRRVPAAGSVGVAAGCLAVGCRPAPRRRPPGLATALRSNPALGVVLRAAPRWLAPRGRSRRGRAARRAPCGPIARRAGGIPSPWPGWGWSCWCSSPATYVGARCRHDSPGSGSFWSSRGSGRPGHWPTGCSRSTPGGRGTGTRCRRWPRTWTGRSSDLEARVADPLPGYATAGDRLNRARDLAMLGRTDGGRSTC